MQRSDSVDSARAQARKRTVCVIGEEYCQRSQILDEGVSVCEHSDSDSTSLNGEVHGKKDKQGISLFSIQYGQLSSRIPRV